MRLGTFFLRKPLCIKGPPEPRLVTVGSERKTLEIKFSTVPNFLSIPVSIDYRRKPPVNSVRYVKDCLGIPMDPVLLPDTDKGIPRISLPTVNYKFSWCSFSLVDKTSSSVKEYVTEVN